MPGKVIGERLNYGYAGTPSRMPDCIIVPYKFDIAHAGKKISFGEPVAFDATNGDTLAVPGAIFTHGQVDGDNVTEITLTQRIV